MDDIWILLAKKLSGEATPEELLDLEQALRRDPELHYSLQFIVDSWGRKPAPTPPAAATAWDRHAARLQANGHFPEGPVSLPLDLFPPPNRRRVFPAFAAISALLLVIGVIYLAVQPKPVAANNSVSMSLPRSEVVTQNGSRTKLLLPDGSSVWLNAGSRLTYDSSFGTKIREVGLTGEAFFDVVKNREKPFVIHTGTINIKVLGTAFNVRSYPGDKTIETSLIRGRIEVTFNNKPARKLILTPNQKLVVDNETGDPEGSSAAALPLGSDTPAVAAGKSGQMNIHPLTRFGPDSLVTETAWVDNRLVFQDESFGDLARQMERWYGVPVILDDEHLDSVHFTGSFEKENIGQALNALQLLSHFAFRLEHGEMHISKPH